MKMYYPSFQELEEHFQENPIRIILLIHTKDETSPRMVGLPNF
jgi:hypothetical protein